MNVLGRSDTFTELRTGIAGASYAKQDVHDDSMIVKQATESLTGNVLRSVLHSSVTQLS